MGAGLEGCDCVLLLGVLGKDDHGEVVGTDPEPMKEIESIFSFEEQIQQNQVRLMLAQGRLGFGDGFRFAATFEFLLAGDPVDQILAKHGMVLNNEDAPFNGTVL
jgi:ABC-type microcin C transport system permease subunit YejB